MQTSKPEREPVFGIWKSAGYDDALKIRLMLRFAAKPYIAHRGYQPRSYTRKKRQGLKIFM
jgi:hypothetical protein